MNKNPFSFYDFLGYLFPGFIALSLIVYVVIMGGKPIESFFSIEDFLKEIEGYKINASWLESTVIVIVSSYVAGHVVAYLSSTTVEYFANHVFEYPSYYLLHPSPQYENVLCSLIKGILRRIFGKEKVCFHKSNVKKRISKFFYPLFAKKFFFQDVDCGRFLWRVIVVSAISPVSFLILLFGSFLSINDFITKPLDEYVRNSIQTKLCDLSKQLNLKLPDVNLKADYHRIVMHYVYLNIPNCQRKADNYVAIYGFLRAVTLISCVFSDYMLITQICTFDPSLSVNWKAIFILLILFLLSNVFFMGFVKFYRRFTLENYMALLTEKK